MFLWRRARATQTIIFKQAQSKQQLVTKSIKWLQRGQRWSSNTYIKVLCCIIYQHKGEKHYLSILISEICMHVFRFPCRWHYVLIIYLLEYLLELFPQALAYAYVRNTSNLNITSQHSHTTWNISNGGFCLYLMSHYSCSSRLTTLKNETCNYAKCQTTLLSMAV